ncbi:MAG TPA: hypothetical protein VEU98_06415 [Candidatus Eremiobacteraceae bacterium]|nr:hypothetical protein [Candidatus Eremiobacteraceae bacterium]
MEWNAMILLGAFHGINPGMGWLFAVALGMQQGNARGVWRALPPIALGHLVSVGVVLLTAALLKLVMPLAILKAVVAAVLILFGGYRLWRHRHPRYGGMQVGFRDLSIWSFLMASAHGAGFMLLPFVMKLSHSASAFGHGDHAACHEPAAALGAPWLGAAALGVHTASYFAVMALAAWIVYKKLGLALLRTAWFNLDWLWAAALVVAGFVVLLA